MIAERRTPDALIAGQPPPTLSVADFTARSRSSSSAASDTELLRTSTTRKHSSDRRPRKLGADHQGRVRVARDWHSRSCRPWCSGGAKIPAPPRRLPGSEWALVALGKFGGCELTATSHLDLMLVTTAPRRAMSDASKSRCRRRNTQPLAQTVVAVQRARHRRCAVRSRFGWQPWGTRVRSPRGSPRCAVSSGCLTHERMVMTRARVISGAPQLSAAIESARAAPHGRRPRCRAHRRAEMRARWFTPRRTRPTLGHHRSAVAGSLISSYRAVPDAAPRARASGLPGARPPPKRRAAASAVSGANDCDVLPPPSPPSVRALRRSALPAQASRCPSACRVHLPRARQP